MLYTLEQEGKWAVLNTLDQEGKEGQSCTHWNKKVKRDNDVHIGTKR